MDGAGARSIVDRDGFLTDLCMIANGTILLVGVSWFEFKVLIFGLNLYLYGDLVNVLVSLHQIVTYKLITHLHGLSIYHWLFVFIILASFQQRDGYSNVLVPYGLIYPWLLTLLWSFQFQLR